MEGAVNILMKEQRDLILETVKRSDATNVGEIMEETNVRTYGRAVTVVTYLCYMYENKRISKEHLVL